MKKEILERLLRIDELIRDGYTGSPTRLAQRVNCSERMIYTYIKFLKDFGAPIQYSRVKESYLYTEPGQFIISFVKELEIKPVTTVFEEKC